MTDPTPHPVSSPALGASPARRDYPMAAPTDDPRFTLGLLIDVADVLALAVALTPMTGGGLAVVLTPMTGGGEVRWPTREAAEAARRPGEQGNPRLCAHADRDGEGMHWLAPGERCGQVVVPAGHLVSLARRVNRGGA